MLRLHGEKKHMGAPRFSSRADFLALTAEICFGRTALGCADAHATGLEYSHYPESWARTVIGTRLPKLARGTRSIHSSHNGHVHGSLDRMRGARRQERQTPLENVF